MIPLNLVGGWLGMLAGVLSGALVGLFFYRDDWMGGYDSWRRRLTRLGHISFDSTLPVAVFAARLSDVHRI